MRRNDQDVPQQPGALLKSPDYTQDRSDPECAFHQVKTVELLVVKHCRARYDSQEELDESVRTTVVCFPCIHLSGDSVKSLASRWFSLDHPLRKVSRPK
jgi:hypothetical protein